MSEIIWVVIIAAGVLFNSIAQIFGGNDKWGE